MWDDSSDNVKSNIVTFGLSTCENKPRKAYKRAAPLEPKSAYTIEIPTVQDPVQPQVVNASPVNEHKMLYHIVNVTNAVEPFLLFIYPEENQTMEIYVSAFERPTPEKHDYHILIPREPSDNSTDEMRHFVYIDVGNITTNRTTVSNNATDRKLFIGVRRHNGECTEICKRIITFRAKDFRPKSFVM